AAGLRFYGDTPGFTAEGSAGPFTIVRAGPDCQLQLVPWGRRAPNTLSVPSLFLSRGSTG
ncbi:MAG TPA: hypothetical protein VF798_07585, partial [Burkholderiaceae bacterium]